MRRGPDGKVHIVALSGGKDSTALALRLAALTPGWPYHYICTPTGNEPPEMFAHWRKLGELLGSRIIPVSGMSLAALIEKQQALPNWRQRWCTRIIKIEAHARFLMQYPHTVSYIGLRADEEAREGGNYAEVPGAETRYPLREWGWGIKEVVGYLEQRDVCIPKRTDCMLCFFQRLHEWHELWRDMPDAYAEGERMETMVGHTFRSPGRDTQPASLKDLRAKFEQGYIPKPRNTGKEYQCRVCSM